MAGEEVGLGVRFLLLPFFFSLFSSILFNISSGVTFVLSPFPLPFLPDAYHTSHKNCSTEKKTMHDLPTVLMFQPEMHSYNSKRTFILGT